MYLSKKGGLPMKEFYQKPAVEIVIFENKDVITTSGLNEGGIEDLGED